MTIVYKKYELKVSSVAYVESSESPNGLIYDHYMVTVEAETE